MSDFPKDLQTPLTQMMKLLDEAGLCMPANKVDPTVMAFTGALKDIDAAIWKAFPLLKAVQEKIGFSTAKLPTVIEDLACATEANSSALLEFLKICHDKKIGVYEGGGI